MGKGSHRTEAQDAHERTNAALANSSEDEKTAAGGASSKELGAAGALQGVSYGVSESEWEHAQRATRTATWGSIFYLITTDILGPYNVPWVRTRWLQYCARVSDMADSF